MKVLLQRPLILWAVGDIQRTPLQAVLLFAAAASLTGLVAIVLVLGQALSLTCDRLMSSSPAVVVRRINVGGWAPLPVGQALMHVKSVPGVLNPRVRLWGVVQTDTGPVTVVAVPSKAIDGMTERPLRSGQALIGPGLMPASQPATMTLRGEQRLSLKVAGRLPAASAMATHDLVLVHPDDARNLLGLAPDQASDLALDVFHDQEVETLCADLNAAFPWPVHISTRIARQRRCQSDIAQRTSISALAFVPALLAMAFLVGALGIWEHNQRFLAALLKALGWDSADLIRLRMVEATLIGLPAVVCGLSCAYITLFRWDMTWVSQRLFGWSTMATRLRLNPGDAVTGMLLSVMMVGLPYLLTVAWTAWQSVKVDPADRLQER